MKNRKRSKKRKRRRKRRKAENKEVSGNKPRHAMIDAHDSR